MRVSVVGRAAEKGNLYAAVINDCTVQPAARALALSWHQEPESCVRARQPGA